jgi:hypothetical protein
MAKADPFLDELSCLTTLIDFSLDRLESCLIKALDIFQGGTKKRQSIAAQILSENIQSFFSRILVRLPPDIVCKSLGFIVAFASGLVDDGIDFALGESFLRFVDSNLFDNCHLSHLVPLEAHSMFVRVLVTALKRPDCKYPQKSLLPWIRKAVSNSNWDLECSVIHSLLDSCVTLLRSSPALLNTTKGEVFLIISELFIRSPVLCSESESAHGDRSGIVSFLVDEATACIESKSLCESACILLRVFMSMNALATSAHRALSSTLSSLLESSDSIILRDHRPRSDSSCQFALLFVDLINSSLQSTSQLHHTEHGSSSLLSSLFSSKASIENGCSVLCFSLSKNPSLINFVNLELIFSQFSSTLDKNHRVADVIFNCLLAISISFTHFFNGPKRRYLSLWDNMCGAVIKFCKHRSSDLASFHGQSAALKSLLPLCSGQSLYPQLETFLLTEHCADSLELFAQFCNFSPCSQALKERSIALAGKLALDSMTQFFEDSPLSRHSHNDRSLLAVVIGARACAKVILASAQCRSHASSDTSALEKVISMLPYMPSRWSVRSRSACPFDGDVTLARLDFPNGAAHCCSGGFKWPTFTSFSSDLGHGPTLKAMSLRELQLDNLRTAFFLREQKSLFEAATHVSSIHSLNDLQKSLDAKMRLRRTHAALSPEEAKLTISFVETSVTAYIASIVKKSDIEHTRLADMSFLSFVLLKCTFTCVHDDKLSMESASKFQFYAVVFSKTWLEKLISSFKSNSSIDFEESLTVLHLILPILTICIALHQQCPGINDFLVEFSKFVFDDILPALVESLLPSNVNKNLRIFDRYSCLNILDAATLLLWCTQIRRRYSHQLILGLCSLVHHYHPFSAAAVLIIHGLRNRLDRVSKEMDTLFAISNETILNPAMFGKQDPSKLKDLLNVPSWFLINSFLVCNYNALNNTESLFHQSMNVFLVFCVNVREANKSSMENVFVLDSSISLLRHLLLTSENSQKLNCLPELRARIDSEVAQILLSNISSSSSYDNTLMKVLSALHIEDVCNFFDFSHVWQSTLDNIPFSIGQFGHLSVNGRLSASHCILGLAIMFAFGVAKPSYITVMLPLVVQLVQKCQNDFMMACSKSMLSLFASKLKISASWALISLFGPELLKKCSSVGCSLHSFPWSIFSVSNKVEALKLCANAIFPAILDFSHDSFGFEDVSDQDKVDIDSSYWSAVIEVVLCHIESSNESSVSLVVQKSLNLIHDQFSSFPSTPVSVYLKESQESDKSDATYVHRILQLLVQRTQWLSSFNEDSLKMLQSSFINNADKLLRLIKQLIPSSSWNCKIFPSSFQEFISNRSLVRIFLSTLLLQLESCLCDHDLVRFSAVMLTVIEGSIESMSQSQVKIKTLSHHLSFCFHVAMRLIQFTCNHHSSTLLVSKVLLSKSKLIVSHPSIFQSFVLDLGVLLLLCGPNARISSLCHELVHECCSCILSFQKNAMHQKLEFSCKDPENEYEYCVRGLLICDLPSFDEFKPFIDLLESSVEKESLEKSTHRWICITKSRCLNGTAIEHHCALQALHLRRLLMIHIVELKKACCEPNMQSQLSMCVSILLESASRWGSSQIISEAVGECISLLAFTLSASCVCFSPSKNEIMSDITFLESAFNLILSFWFSWNASISTAAVCDIEDYCLMHRQIGNMENVPATFSMDLCSSSARYFHKHIFATFQDVQSRLAHHISHIQDENYDHHVKNIVWNLSLSLPASNDSVQILMKSCHRTILTSNIFVDMISPRVILRSFELNPQIKVVCSERLLCQQQIALAGQSDYKINNKGLCRIMTNARVYAKCCLVQRMGLPSKSASLAFVEDPFGSDPLSAAKVADLAGMRSAAIQLIEPLDASSLVTSLDSRWARWNVLCGVSDAISLICGADASTDPNDDFFYQFSENWSCSLTQFDSHCKNSIPSPTAVLGIVNALQHLGAHFAANHMLLSTDKLSDPCVQRQFDSAYHKNVLRCDFTQTYAFKKHYSSSLVGLETNHCFETIMCTALGLLHQNRVAECKSACERAMQLVISNFADMDVLSVIENQASLAKLRSCTELAMLCQFTNKEDVLKYSLEVCGTPIPIHWDFEAHDLISNVRRGMISATTKVLHTDLGPRLTQFQLIAAKTARKNGKFSYANSSLMQASDVLGRDNCLVVVERAKLAWAAGERRRAFSIISSLRGALAEYRVLRWTIEDRTDTFEVVRNRVSKFDSHIKSECKTGFISSEKCMKLLSKIRYAFASYSDSMYRNLFDFLKSPEFLQQSRIQQALGAEAEKLKSDSRSHQSKRRNIETQVDVQQNVLSAAFSNFHMYFAHALENYSYVLKIGERTSLSAILRFASLLFSSTLASSEDVKIPNLFDGIPEQEFLPIFMQFIARLKDDSSSDGMFASFAGVYASFCDCMR